jgi:hypothetical protein
MEDTGYRVFTRDMFGLSVLTHPISLIRAKALADRLAIKGILAVVRDQTGEFVYTPR